MKTKSFQIPVTTVEFKQVDIQFPFYRRQELDHSVTVSKVDLRDDGRLDLIELTAGEDHGSYRFEIQVTENYRFDQSSYDYLLGQGIYACSEKDFDRIFSEMTEALNKSRKISASPRLRG